MPDLGPVLPEEAAVLTALTKMMAPATVVQFGFFCGDSARALLEGMPEESRLFSFDILPRRDLDDPRHTLIIKDMRECGGTDFEQRAIDILFIDASHIYEDNLAAWEKVRGWLSVGALVVVHDTGIWNRKLVPNEWPQLMADSGHAMAFGEKGIVHCPGEHEFTMYLEQVEEWHSIRLTPTHVLRHGLTVLQK